eukprot:g50222.t1
MSKQQHVPPPHHVSGLTNGSTLQEKGLECLIQAFLSPWGPNTQAANRLPAPTPKQKENSHQRSGVERSANSPLVTLPWLFGWDGRSTWCWDVGTRRHGMSVAPWAPWMGR